MTLTPKSVPDQSSPGPKKGGGKNQRLIQDFLAMNVPSVLIEDEHRTRNEAVSLTSRLALCIRTNSYPVKVLLRGD
jgi:hypothetical protein